jgi:ureidoglycolate dehydrogenase (NAD+)
MSPTEVFVNIEQENLIELATAALRGYGISKNDARDASRILVLADMFGVHTHGVSRISSYGERLQVGAIKAQPDIRIERVAAVISRIDGDNGVGPLVGMRALDAAMDLAREFGAGIAFVRNSNHFGPVSSYSYIAAQQGFASMIASNTNTMIAPWGGRDARVGNNPIGLCVPNPAGDPIMLDMALSVAARAKVRRALDRGETIPSTWATDRGGHPTTDPRAALDGFMLAIGGHKGYGLALMMDLLAGLLSGANYLTHVRSWLEAPSDPQNLGHFFLLLDSSRLGPQEWLAERMTDFAAIVHDTPPADPNAPVLLPGEIEMRKFRRAEKEGIMLERKVLDELRARAARVAV